MQPNKTKLSLAIGAICFGFSGGSQAATANFDITVNTIPDVTLSEEVALDYGTTMFVGNGGTCLMNAATPGNAVARMQYTISAASAAAASDYGDLSGDGCVNGTGTGTPGIYKITGLESLNVRITISGVVGADFSFSPNSGCIVNYNGAATANSGDSCTTFVPGVQTTRQLAAAAGEDATTSVEGDASVAGELVFTVGGTVTVGGTDLTANTAYSENFPVNVVY